MIVPSAAVVPEATNVFDPPHPLPWYTSIVHPASAGSSDGEVSRTPFRLRSSYFVTEIVPESMEFSNVMTAKSDASSMTTCTPSSPPPPRLGLKLENV